MSPIATRLLKVLRETGPRPLTVILGFAGGSQKEMQRIVGELFIAGVVKWVSAKRWRRLAAIKVKARGS